MDYKLTINLVSYLQKNLDRTLMVKNRLLKYIFKQCSTAEKVNHQLSSLPLSNDTVRGHIDEIANDVQSQLNDILWNTNFSLVLVFQTSAIFDHLFG